MHPSLFRRVLLWVLAFYVITIGVYYNFFHSFLPAANDISFKAPLERCEITGTVKSYVKTIGSKPSVEFAAQELNGLPVSGTLLLYLNNLQALKGQQLTVKGRLEPPKDNVMPGSFSWSGYLAQSDIFTLFYADEITIIKDTPFYHKAIVKLRSRFVSAFKDSFNEKQSIIINGITLGYKQGGDKELYENLRRSGAMHLLVASGSNVAFVILIVYFLLSLLGISKKYKVLSGFAAAAFYVLIAGAEAPLLRAFIMAVAAAAGLALGRVSGAVQGVVIAALVMLIINPAALLGLDFILSFIAVMAVIIVSDTYNKHLLKMRGIYKVPLTWLLLTCASQIALFPVLANSFHEVSAIGPLSNFFLIPLASCIMFLGLIYLTLAAFLPAMLQPLIYFPLDIASGLFVWLVNFFAGFSFASLAVPRLPFAFYGVWYPLCFLLFSAANKAMLKAVWKPSLAISFLSLCLLAFIGPQGKAYVFKDYKRSYAVIRSEKGAVCVFNMPSNGENIKNTVLWLGSKKVEALVLSSFTHENVEEIVKAAAKIKFETIYLPAALAGSADLEDLRKTGANVIKVPDLLCRENGDFKVCMHQKTFGAGNGFDKIDTEIALGPVAVEDIDGVAVLSFGGVKQAQTSGTLKSVTILYSGDKVYEKRI